MDKWKGVEWEQTGIALLISNSKREKREREKEGEKEVFFEIKPYCPLKFACVSCMNSLFIGIDLRNCIDPCNITNWMFGKCESNLNDKSLKKIKELKYV